MFLRKLSFNNGYFLSLTDYILSYLGRYLSFKISRFITFNSKFPTRFRTLFWNVKLHFTHSTQCWGRYNAHIWHICIVIIPSLTWSDTKLEKHHYTRSPIDIDVIKEERDTLWDDFLVFLEVLDQDYSWKIVGFGIIGLGEPDGSPTKDNYIGSTSSR